MLSYEKGLNSQRQGNIRYERPTSSRIQMHQTATITKSNKRKDHYSNSDIQIHLPKQLRSNSSQIRLANEPETAILNERFSKIGLHQKRLSSEERVKQTNVVNRNKGIVSASQEIAMADGII